MDIFSDLQVNSVLFAKIDQVFSLKDTTFRKYWKSQGILSVRKSGNHGNDHSVGLNARHTHSQVMIRMFVCEKKYTACAVAKCRNKSQERQRKRAGLKPPRDRNWL